MKPAIIKLANLDPLWPRVLESIRAAVPELKAVLCYGSRVGGCATENSDFDVIVITAEQWPWSKQIKLEQNLSRRVGKNVDVRVISVEGLRNLRLMDPYVHFALATGVIVGDSEIIYGHVPLALAGIRNMLENVELELDDLDIYEEQDTRIEQLRKCVRDLIVIGQILEDDYSIQTYHEKVNRTLGNVASGNETQLKEIVRGILAEIRGRIGSMTANESDRYLEAIING
jgi:predicted nucleotidyltransferase